MNAKTAKMLRKIARQLGNELGPDTVEFGQVENTKKRKKRIAEKRDDNGQIIYGEDGISEKILVDISLGTITNTPNSIHGIYRNLKKVKKNPALMDKFSKKSTEVVEETEAA
jgi:hypothetical protein